MGKRHTRHAAADTVPNGSRQSSGPSKRRNSSSQSDCGPGQSHESDAEDKSAGMRSQTRTCAQPNEGVYDLGRRFAGGGDDGEGRVECSRLQHQRLTDPHSVSQHGQEIASACAVRLDGWPCQ
eukprot:1266990-Rhodomonas_salina.4